MAELTPETEAFLKKLAVEESLSQPEIDRLREFGAWATPERLALLLGITSKIANSVLPARWETLRAADGDEVLSTDPVGRQFVEQPGFVMLREVATGRTSTTDSDWSAPRFPEEQVLHFCRLWALIETERMPPQIWDLVRVVGDAEDRLKSDPSDLLAKGQLNTAMSQLDVTMEGWISQDPQLEGFVNVLYLLLVTDDEEQAFRVDPGSDEAIRKP